MNKIKNDEKHQNKKNIKNNNELKTLNKNNDNNKNEIQDNLIYYKNEILKI